MSCPVCFGGEDPVVRESLNAGIGVLLGVTGVVLGCFGTFFVRLAKRAREYGEWDRESFVEETPVKPTPGSPTDGAHSNA